MKNWNNYSVEHYLFVFSQSEKKLAATIDSMNSIQSRGRFQLSIGIAIITGLIGWFVQKTEIGFMPIAIVIGSQTAISIIFAILGIYRYKISVLGSSPDDLFHVDLYSTFINVKDAEKNLIYNECLDYAQRIERNYSINRKRLKFLTWSFILLALLPLSALISWFLFQNLNFLFGLQVCP